MNIKKLINNNNWNKIYELIINNKLDPNKEISNGNTVAHLAAINNNSKLINYFIDNNKSILYKSNDEGNTPIHLLAIYGYVKLLKDCIKKNPKFLNLLNNNNENIPNLLYSDIDFIDWIFKNKYDKYDKYELIIDDINGQNIITKNINDTKENNDINYKIIKSILNNNLDLVNRYDDSLLCYAIKENKSHIANLLINKKYDLNKKDRSYITPFIYAVKSKDAELIKLLIDKGADINYNGPEGDHNPLIWAINNDDELLVNLLVDKGFDVNSYNRYIETPVHFILNNKNNVKMSPTTISKMLYYGDLNIKNVNGQTPLHLLCKYHNWKNYDKIMKHKELDIFIEDKDKKRPFDYINGNFIYDFMNLIVNSYSRQIDGKIGKKIGEKTGNIKKINTIDQCKKNPKSSLCKNELKKYIFKTKRSIPLVEDKIKMENKMTMIKGNNTEYGMFNSDSLHNMIYTMIIMMKYKNIGIPFQYYFNDKYINDKIIQNNNDLYSQPAEFVISDLVRIYTDYFYEIVPYLIVWRDKDRYFVHKDLEFHLNKCLVSDKIRFVFLKLTLVITQTSTHANLIIYDKINNTLERFEPYGVIPYLESNNLDIFIENLGRTYIKNDLKYLSPKDIFGSIGFQTISNDSQHSVKKLGDPNGFCLAWTFWYLEMKINNPDAHPSTFIKQAIDDITNRSGIDGDKLFISFIRDYAFALDKNKNIFMKNAGINSNNMYNLVLSPLDQKNVIKYLTDVFNKIVVERYI